MGEGRRPHTVLIAGPTASGKSALAMSIAERTGGVVVNADSMQVYRELRILTARPSEADEARVEHRLYGHVGAGEAYTVARWLADVEPLLADLGREGRTAVIVGGTGLYFTALTQGLSEVPPVPAAVRNAVRALADRLAPGDLHAVLSVEDPAMAARLSPGDVQRITRALEVRRASGRSLSVWQATRPAPLVAVDQAEALVIAPDRAWLRERIASRFRAMVDGGGLAEARDFADLRLDPALPAMRAIGVPEMIAAATGALDPETAVAAAVTATRQYAKRQETWFRNQFRDWRRVDPAVTFDGLFQTGADGDDGP